MESKWALKFFSGLCVICLIFIILITVREDLNIRNTITRYFHDLNHIETPRGYKDSSLKKTGTNIWEDNITKTYKLSENINQMNAPIILFYEQHPAHWFSPFSLDGICSHKCVFTKDSSLINKSDAIIIFRTLRKPPPKKLLQQKWIYFTNESPVQLYPLPGNRRWRNSWDKFDWLLSYRLNSDIKLPFGVLNKVSNPPMFNYSSIFRRKTKYVAWLVSNCKTQSKREKYVGELKKYIDVDIYGSCGPKKCSKSKIGNPKEYTACKTMISNDYKFYLSFENFICDNYVSEKVFGLFETENFMVPVVRSAPNVKSFLPTGTFISTADFASLKLLAEYLKLIGSSEESYSTILKAKHQYKLTPWTKNYRPAICDLCSKLTNGYRKQTEDTVLEKLLHDKCYKPKDI